MDMIRLVIVSLIVGLQLLNPQTTPSPVNKTPLQQQVLGETTKQDTSWHVGITTTRDCSNSLACMTFCSKSENKKKCTDFFYSKGMLTATGSAGRTYSSVKPSIVPSSSNSAQTTQKRTDFFNNTSKDRNTSASHSSFLTAPPINQFRGIGDQIPASPSGEKKTAFLKYKEEYTKTMIEKQNLLKSMVNGGGTVATRESEIQKRKTGEATFKAHLETIHNAQKKQLVLTINTKIAQINKNATDRMNTALDKLSSILTTLNSQITNLQTQNTDTTNAETLSLTAQSAIIDAQGAVINQLGQDYTLQIGSDEGKLKDNIAPVVVLLKNNLDTTKQIVEKAKGATTAVYKEVYSLKKTYQISLTPTLSITNTVVPTQ